MAKYATSTLFESLLRMRSIKSWISDVGPERIISISRATNRHSYDEEELAGTQEMSSKEAVEVGESLCIDHLLRLD